MDMYNINNNVILEMFKGFEALHGEVNVYSVALTPCVYSAVVE